MKESMCKTTSQSRRSHETEGKGQPVQSDKEWSKKETSRQERVLGSQLQDEWISIAHLLKDWLLEP